MKYADTSVQIPSDVMDELRSICLSLPETYEEKAWAGTRWMIRRKNFGHVLEIENGWPPAYAAAASSKGPMYVLTFRTGGELSEPPEFNGYPFFRPGWFPNIIGMILDDDVDWEHVCQYLTKSYCELAPKKLAALASERYKWAKQER